MKKLSDLFWLSKTLLPKSSERMPGKIGLNNCECCYEAPAVRGIIHKTTTRQHRFSCCESCARLDTEAFWERFIHNLINRILKYQEEGYYLE